jgi:nucleotide-binding universal stress UspA family protein
MDEVIVVGVDGSSTALEAARSARALAAALGTALHIVTAFETDEVQVYGEGTDQVRISTTERAEVVARLLTKDSGQPGVRISHAALHAKPAEALISEAARLEARVIVVGNRRMRGLGRVLGSVASSVAHNAPCDVYIANTYDTADQ